MKNDTVAGDIDEHKMKCMKFSERGNILYEAVSCNGMHYGKFLA
jgi:hypothetical protein